MGAKNWIFGFPGFSGNADFGNFPMGFGVWESLQWIENGCGLQMDGFSAHFYYLSPFSTFFVISVILLSFPLV